MTPTTTHPPTAVLPGPSTVNVTGDVVVVAPQERVDVLRAAVAQVAALSPEAQVDRLPGALAGSDPVAVAVRSGSVWAVALTAGMRLQADHVGHRLQRGGPFATVLRDPVGLGLLPDTPGAAPLGPSVPVAEVGEGWWAGSGIWLQVEAILGVPNAQVEGITCSCGSFVHPLTVSCLACGMLLQPPRTTVLAPPVPVARIVMDDGRALPLGGAVVIGRDPTADPRVAAGSAMPLVLTDSQRSVSRSHLTVTIDGWDLIMQDDGSSNGTAVRPPSAGEWTALDAGQAVRILPGSQVQVGRRGFRVM